MGGFVLFEILFTVFFALVFIIFYLVFKIEKLKGDVENILIELSIERSHIDTLRYQNTMLAKEVSDLYEKYM